MFMRSLNFEIAKAKYNRNDYILISFISTGYTVCNKHKTASGSKWRRFIIQKILFSNLKSGYKVLCENSDVNVLFYNCTINEIVKIFYASYAQFYGTT